MIRVDEESVALQDDVISCGSDPSETTAITVASNTSSSASLTRRVLNQEPLSWKYFTVDFHSTVGPANFRKMAELEKACEPWEHKVINLRPYMEARPFTCFRKDSYQKALSIFRLMDCRQMPVLDEKRNCALVGIITRQDLFKYMWIT